MAAHWHHPLPQCVPGLEESGFNDGHLVQKEYNDIVTWAHRIAIVARQTKHSKLSMRLRATSQNSLALHEDRDLQRKVR
jgi:hypothetical protein